MLFFKLSLQCFLYLFFTMFIAVNEVSSKHEHVSRSLISFKEKFSFSRIFKCPWKGISNSSTFQAVQGPAKTLYKENAQLQQLKGS